MALGCIKLTSTAKIFHLTNHCSSRINQSLLHRAMMKIKEIVDIYKLNHSKLSVNLKYSCPDYHTLGETSDSSYLTPSPTSTTPR